MSRSSQVERNRCVGEEVYLIRRFRVLVSVLVTMTPTSPELPSVGIDESEVRGLGVSLRSVGIPKVSDGELLIGAWRSTTLQFRFPYLRLGLTDSSLGPKVEPVP